MIALPERQFTRILQTSSKSNSQLNLKCKFISYTFQVILKSQLNFK
jgi:hypothetical protein